MNEMNYPSVTQLIQSLQVSSYGPPATEGNPYLLRGRKVHKSCALIARNLWSKPLPIEYQGYIASFKKWKDMMIKEVINSIEEEFIDEVYGFVGHPDLIAILQDDSLCLLDLKTSASPWPGDRLQIAAYRALVSQLYEVDKAGDVYLDKEGKMAKLVWCEKDANDFAIFLSLLNVYRFFAKE